MRRRARTHATKMLSDTIFLFSRQRRCFQNVARAGKSGIQRLVSGVDAHAKNIFELFLGKFFQVPDYQRNYAWELKNQKDLWNDIKEGMSTKTSH